MYGQAATELRDLIASAGVQAAVDAERINLPGVLVVPTTISPSRLDPFDGSRISADVTWDLYLIAPDVSPTRALDVLGEMVSKLVKAGIPLGDLTPVSVDLVSRSSYALPALKAEITTEVS